MASRGAANGSCAVLAAALWGVAALALGACESLRPFCAVECLATQECVPGTDGLGECQPKDGPPADGAETDVVGSDVCTDATCGCTTAADCPAPDPPNACQVAVCRTDRSCGLENVADGTECDDGDACTAADKCLAGACVGQSGECPCNSNKDCARHDDPNDKCAARYACVSKVCILDRSSATTCEDQDPGDCWASVCQPQSGECVQQQKAAEQPCTSDDWCQVHSRCDATGACVGQLRECTPEPLGCGINWRCDSAARKCTSTPVASGQACDGFAPPTDSCHGTCGCLGFSVDGQPDLDAPDHFARDDRPRSGVFHYYASVRGRQLYVAWSVTGITDYDLKQKRLWFVIGSKDDPARPVPGTLIQPCADHYWSHALLVAREDRDNAVYRVSQSDPGGPVGDALEVHRGATFVEAVLDLSALQGLPTDLPQKLELYAWIEHWDSTPARVDSAAAAKYDDGQPQCALPVEWTVTEGTCEEPTCVCDP
jgi:hypothetical protein